MARPTDTQVEEFTKKLRAWRDTLPEEDQRLVNAMYYAAMGEHAAQNDEVQSYWVAAGPRGVVAGGPGGWVARPWGVAYGAYYPAYW